MKKRFRIFPIMLIVVVAVIFNGCNEPMTSQMDTVVGIVTDDSPPTKPVAPPSQPVATLPAGTVVFVEPTQVTSPAVGQQLQLRINIKEAADVLAYEMMVGFDPTALRYVSIANADYLPAGAFAAPPRVTGNSVHLAATSAAGVAAAARGTLAIVTFEVVSVKASTITLNNVQVSDNDLNPLTFKTVGGTVTAP